MGRILRPPVCSTQVARTLASSGGPRTPCKDIPMSMISLEINPPSNLKRTIEDGGLGNTGRFLAGNLSAPWLATHIRSTNLGCPAYVSELLFPFSHELLQHRHCAFVSWRSWQPDGRCFPRPHKPRSSLFMLSLPSAFYRDHLHAGRVLSFIFSKPVPTLHRGPPTSSAVTGNLAILIESSVPYCIVHCTKNTGIDNRPKWSQLRKAPVWPARAGPSDGAWAGRRKWATDARPRRSKCIRPSPAVIKLVPYPQISSKCWHIPKQTSCRVQFPFLRPPVTSNSVTFTTLRAAGNHGLSTTQHVWEHDGHGVVTE